MDSLLCSTGYALLSSAFQCPALGWICCGALLDLSWPTKPCYDLRCRTGSGLPYSAIPCYGLVYWRCSVLRFDTRPCTRLLYWLSPGLLWPAMHDSALYCSTGTGLPCATEPCSGIDAVQCFTGGGLLLLYYDWLCSGLLAFLILITQSPSSVSACLAFF